MRTEVLFRVSCQVKDMRLLMGKKEEMEKMAGGSVLYTIKGHGVQLRCCFEVDVIKTKSGLIDRETEAANFWMMRKLSTAARISLQGKTTTSLTHLETFLCLQ